MVNNGLRSFIIYLTSFVREKTLLCYKSAIVYLRFRLKDFFLIIFAERDIIALRLTLYECNLAGMLETIEDNLGIHVSDD
jgi:hypothetical protein